LYLPSRCAGSTMPRRPAIDRFLDEPVLIAATYFTLDELVRASETAGFTVTRAERRAPYSGESTVRLYVEATTT